MGATLYCLCVGKVPYKGDNIVELYENIRSAEYVSLCLLKTCEKGLPFHSRPEYSENISPTLKDLFIRILDKNPDTRITISGLRIHPWVTNNGQEPLLSLEENFQGVVTYVTPEEILAAITRLGTVFTVVSLFLSALK